jgi:hypothetical protein
MKSEQSIFKILERVFPLEYEIAGDDAVELIVENEHIKVYNSPGGNNFDFQSTLTIISSAVVLIKSIYEIVEKHQKLAQKLNADQVQEELSTPKFSSKIDKERIKQIIDLILTSE